MNSSDPKTTLLRQLSGLSIKTWEKSCPTNTGDTASSETPQNVDNLEGAVTHPEDSGYESPSSKTEESQETSLHLSRSVSPSLHFKSNIPSRIPVSKSAVKVGQKRSLDDSRMLIVPAFTTAKSNAEAHLETSSEESRSQSPPNADDGHRPSSFVIQSRLHSRSVPAFLNQMPGQNSNQNPNENGGTLRKLVPPRFNIQPPSPSLMSSVQFPVTPLAQLPSMYTMLKASDSFKAIQELVEENVHEILDNGQQEFSGKYSTWIQQVFNLQLEKVHSKLRAAYTERLNQSIEEKKAEVLEIKSFYRTKLLEFESATKKFQEWYADVIEENRRQADINHRLISQLLEKEASLQRDHETQLQAQLIEVEAEAERERAHDLEKHTEQLKQITEKNEAQNQLMVSQYQHQIELLDGEVKTLQDTNAVLQRKLDTLQNKEVELGTASGDDELTAENENRNETGREILESEIRVLQTRIEDMENRRKEVAVAHADEIEKLHKILDLNNQKLRQLIQETRVNASATREERERNIRETQAKILGKEAEFKRRLNALTQRYGKKIEELTHSVELLRSQLLTQCE